VIFPKAVGFAQKVEIDAARRLSRIVTDFQPAEESVGKINVAT
jgi:hypothetical protein